jgi:L-ascorbate metabolism protein UlaG (beta-lactamase superfamily)
MANTLTFFGHGTFGLTIDKIKILIDPFFTGNPATGTKAEDLTPDYLLITHGHGDHVGDAVEIVERTGAKVIANAEIAKWLAARGAEVFP